MRLAAFLFDPPRRAPHLGLWIADDKTMEHLVHLLGFGSRNLLLGLEDLVVLGKRLFPDSLHGFGLVFRELEIGLHFLSNFDNCIPGHFNIRCQSFFLNDALDGDDV